MKEMVSWRGVAKKRRKQEAGAAVIQMFPCCCSHATIVARRQPLSAHKSAVPSKNFVPGDQTLNRSQPEGDHWRSSARIAPHASRSTLPSETALPRIGQRNSNDINSACLSIPPLRTPKITSHAMHGVRKGSRHFCAAGTFCASFRHAMMRLATCAPSALVIHMRERTTRYAICRRCLDHPLELRRMPKDRRKNAFRVTILPLRSANPPRTRPATGPFCCFFFDAGEGSCLTSFPRASREAFPKSVVVSSP